jgi:hypothetical protein
MTIVRFAVWLWSIGWLHYSASTIPDGNALGTWISVCCFATGVVIDGVLTAGDASPVGDDMAPFQFRRGEKGSQGSSVAEFAKHYFESKEAKSDGVNQFPPSW